ncbi:MAG TPA: amidohydrolase [Gemmatimonadales bacterium]|nr:amidohydrolase [Gemmatimonadales bacterium]
MIRAVGSFDLVREEAARAGGPARPVFELPHALLTPGIVDAHTHFGEWALGRSRVQLAGSATRAEAVGRVAAATPADGWILGQGYDPNLWRDPPTREALDAAVPAVPVALDSHDVHALWVNSPALAACGITRATPDPDGGRIVRDANGEPTGVLLERAVSLVTRRLPAVGPDRLLSAVAGAQTAAHRLGVTGIQNVEGPDVLAAFRRLEREDRLRLRVLAHHALEGLDDALAAGVRSGTGSHWLEAGGVKLFLDGALGSQTAWMLEPYRGSDGRGIEVLGLDAARDAVTRGAAGGIAAVVHAIGDAAVRRALDLLEPLPRVGIAHRIEHLQLVHPDDLGRAARAGIVASMQPAHLLTDIPLVERHWGARGAGAYAFRTLLDLGTRLVFGSDVPVETIDPRDGVYAALERVGRDGTPAGGWRAGEKLTFAETLAAYSESGWAAAGRRGKGGVVVAGGAADLVAWACDADAVLKDSGTAFKEGRAVLTVAGGEVMWRET